MVQDLAAPTVQGQMRTATVDARWKWMLLTLCAIAAILVITSTIGILGLGGRPWWGYWDGEFVRVTDRPYQVMAFSLRPGGALARAGVRAGDRADFRDQTLDARVALYTQPPAFRQTTFVLQRGKTTVIAAFVGSTAWSGSPLLKISPIVLNTVKSFFLIACAALLAFRRASMREARVLAVALLCFVTTGFLGPLFVVPNDAVALLLLTLQMVCPFIALLLLVRLSSGYGVPSAGRRVFQWCATIAIAAAILATMAGAYGVATLRVDPIVFWPYSSVFALGIPALYGAVLVLAIWATVTTPASIRPRVAWLLLPLPIAMGACSVLLSVTPFAVWAIGMSLNILITSLALSGALAVSYALLKRRVLDFEFVLSRTLVVATVSLIVVSAFVLLEWLLGTVLAGVSHATGLIANAALALALGLSMHAIHKRVDSFVEAVMFRRRHEDERALRDFSKEAAYVTDAGALFDQTIDRIKRHTDARNAAIFISEGDFYAVTRSFGNGATPNVSENDSAVLALKTWRSPLDPHRYETALKGALAFPILGRGRLTGVLVLGERAGGESYAPDETEALSQVASGVGSALEMLAHESDAGSHAKLEAIVARLDAIDASLLLLRETQPRP